MMELYQIKSRGNVSQIQNLGAVESAVEAMEVAIEQGRGEYWLCDEGGNIAKIKVLRPAPKSPRLEVAHGRA